jgi:hypothetical protein
MPRIDRDTQDTLWKIGDSLQRKLVEPPAPGTEGDPRWHVTQLVPGGWKIDHPDLPLVKDTEGTSKDILLQLHIARQGDPEGHYLVVAQDKVIGPGSHNSPQAEPIARLKGPITSWDADGLATAAATFFRRHKDELIAKARATMPKTPPGALGAPPQQPPGGGPGLGGGMPIASRRRRVARLVQRGSGSSWSRSR